MLGKLFLPASLMFLANAAGAADLPARWAPASPVASAPAFNWSGFHVGVNAGYGWGNVGSSNASTTTDGTFPGFPAVPATYFGLPSSGDADGFLGGVQLGYSMQFGSVVAGVEADYQFSGIRGSRTYLGSAAGPFFREDADVDQIGTIRGRLGYAFDRFMVYGTGGLAVGRLKAAIGITPGTTGIGTTFADSDSKVSIGYAVGAGIEAAISNDWSVKAEYLYLDLGKEDYNFDIGSGATATGTIDTDAHVARVGLNYRFGSR